MASTHRNSHRFLRTIVAIAFAVGSVCSAIAPRMAAAQDEADTAKETDRAGKPSTLDDALLDDLDNELLDGAGDLKSPRGAPRRIDNDAPAGKAGKNPDAELIDDTVDTEAADPLVHIGLEMRQVEELIPEASRRAHAEQLQQRIIDDLARLIEQAESQQSQSSQSQKNQKSRAAAERQKVQQPKQAAGDSDENSDKPAEDSTNRLGRAEAARPDPELFRQMMKDTWGHLPPRDREQMLQTTPDKFLPKYELLIEQYYKRLAEEP